MGRANIFLQRYGFAKTVARKESVSYPKGLEYTTCDKHKHLNYCNGPHYHIRRRSKRIMGPSLMDRSLRTFLGNKGSDTERSPQGGLKLMVTWSVSCKPSRRVREFLNLKEKGGRECKERLATIGPRPTQRQRKALTCSCLVESYGGSYRKGSYLQVKFRRTQSEMWLKRSG